VLDYQGDEGFEAQYMEFYDMLTAQEEVEEG